jgi:hypothetical protein
MYQTMTMLARAAWALAAIGCAAAPSSEPRPTVRFFIATECPVSNFYAPEMRRLAQLYGPRGVRFVAVYAEPGLTDEAARGHARAYGLPLEIELDHDLSQARAGGVVRVPTAVLAASDGRVVYRGRIDDRYAPDGRRRDEPRTHELEDALGAVLAGRSPDTAEAPVFGCPLSRKEPNP